NVSTQIAGAGVSCPKIFNVTTTLQVNQPAAITGQPASTIGCVGTSQTLTMAVTGSPITYQWEVSTDNGVTWSIIPGETNRDITIANPTPIFATYLYRNKVNSPAPCTNALTSNNASLKLKHVWIGNTDGNWNTASNWSDGAVPNNSCPDVYILGSRPFQPTLASGTGIANNLFVEAGAFLTVNGTGMLQIGGTITKAATGTFSALNGTIVLNGTALQTINGAVFLNKTVKNLIVRNNVNLNTDTLRVSAEASIDSTLLNKTLASNGWLTLGSTASGTANMGVLKNGNVVTGNVTVERYIPAGRKWRFLAIPTNTIESFKQSWMEGAATVASNPKPGYGMFITDSSSNWSTNGFDALSIGGPTIKLYNAVVDKWLGITNTGNAINTIAGLMTFVRGDRSGGVPATNTGTNTVLRTSGTLKQGPQNIAVPANEFYSVGNPYASTLDVRNLQKTNVPNTFYLWDPKLGGLYGVGGYQTLVKTFSIYEVIPGGGSYPASGIEFNEIQSGQAFFVRTPTAGAALNFTESAKITGSTMVYGHQGAGPGMLRSNLHIFNSDGTTKLVDAAVAIFDDNFSTAVDFDDALKLLNGTDNVAIKTSGKLLVLERRPDVTVNDTLHLFMSSLRQQPYQWNFKVSNMEVAGRTGFLVDKYLNTTTALSLDGENIYNFTVDANAGSYANDRFMIVFNQVSVVPVTFTSISAVRSNANQIAVSWKVENEINIQQYSIERSVDGRGFLGIATANATSNNGNTANYLQYDNSPVSGDNYYRIKATSIGGQVQYSAIVKVAPIKLPSSIKVLPNPVVNKTMQLVFAGMKEGNYQAQLFDTKGQLVFSSSIAVSGSNMTRSVQLPVLLASGTYKLQVTGTDGIPATINVFIE
ncbi:MAG: T9SS type A sorting domain-containing protein, partial [Ferruginibacter sp.]